MDNRHSIDSFFSYVSYVIVVNYNGFVNDSLHAYIASIASIVERRLSLVVQETFHTGTWWQLQLQLGPDAT